MSKEAKIGLGVIAALLIVLGGVAFYKFRPHSAPTAQADGESKEKAKAEDKSGHADTRPGESKTHPGAGNLQKKDDRNLWNGVADYRKPRQPGSEAKAIVPPPSTMPNPPTPENDDPNDRYGFNRQLGTLPTSDPPEPPGEAAVASSEGGKHGRDLVAERSNADNRFKDKSPLEGRFAAEDRSAGPPLQDIRGNNHPRDLSKSGPAAVTAGGERYGRANLNEPASTNYKDNLRGGPGPYDRGPSPYDRGPSAAFVGREPHHRGGNAYSGLNEPSSMMKNGSRGDGTYDVQPNDSFWTISEKIYGTSSYFKALEELNRGKAVDGQLKVGQNILTPDVAELEKRYPKLCPKEEHREVLQNHDAMLASARNLRGTRSYTVVEGDTLFDIARYELGKASRWAEIYELNQNVLGKDFDYLVPGTELALPEDNPTRPDPITRRPDWGQRRE